MKQGIFKTCGCGRSYDRSGWRELPFVGIQSLDEEGGFVMLAELRNCSCGSTLSRPLAGEDRTVRLIRQALDEHVEMQEALVAVQRRCSELLEENRRLKTLTSNAFYGKMLASSTYGKGETARERSREAWSEWDAEMVQSEIAPWLPDGAREIDARSAYPAELLRLRRNAWRLGVDQAIAFVEDTARLYHARPESEGVAGHLDELARLLRSRTAEWGKSI